MWYGIQRLIDCSQKSSHSQEYRECELQEETATLDASLIGPKSYLYHTTRTLSTIPFLKVTTASEIVVVRLDSAMPNR